MAWDGCLHLREPKPSLLSHVRRSFSNYLTYGMTEFRTDAAFSNISGTLIPSSESINNFIVTRRRNGQIQSIHTRWHEASLKHHRLVHDHTVYQFPIITPYTGYYQDNTNTIFYATGPSSYVDIHNNGNSAPQGDMENVTLASAVDDNNTLVYFKVDDRFNYFRIGNDSIPSLFPESYAELSKFSVNYIELVVPDGLFIGQQLSIVRSDTNTNPFIVSASNSNVYFLRSHFSANLLIIVWDGTTWKRLAL